MSVKSSSVSGQCARLTVPWLLVVARAAAMYLANPIDDNAWLDQELALVKGTGASPLLLSDGVGLVSVLLGVAHAAEGISFHLLRSQPGMLRRLLWLQYLPLVELSRAKDVSLLKIQEMNFHRIFPMRVNCIV